MQQRACPSFRSLITTGAFDRSIALRPLTRTHAPVHSIEKHTFFAALVLAPILFAALFFWISLIPVAAVVFGGVPYLLIGDPLLWRTMARHGEKADFIGIAFIANLASTPILTGLFMLVFEPIPDVGDILSAIFYMTGFGMVFAPIWALLFGMLYRSLIHWTV